MRTHEVEKLLGIKRERIRYFKEKQVFTPERPPHGSHPTEYTDADIEKLKELIVLTTAGLTCDDIKKVQNGTRTLAEVIIERRPERERKLLQLDRSMDLNQSILMDNIRSGTFDVDSYWAQISAQSLPAADPGHDKSGDFSCRVEISCPYCGTAQTVDLMRFVQSGYSVPDAAESDRELFEEFDSGMASDSRLRCRQCRMPIQIHGKLRSDLRTHAVIVEELILEPDASYDPLHEQHEKQ